MRIVRDSDVPVEDFPGGATYRTLVGDDAGSTPVRTGIQTSPPGYATADHWILGEIHDAHLAGGDRSQDAIPAEVRGNAHPWASQPRFE